MTMVPASVSIFIGKEVDDRMLGTCARLLPDEIMLFLFEENVEPALLRGMREGSLFEGRKKSNTILDLLMYGGSPSKMQQNWLKDSFSLFFL